MTHLYIDLIKAHASCQSGMYLNGTYRDTHWFGGFSEVVSDFFWNFVSPVKLPNDNYEDQVYDFYQQIERNPALYGESEFISKAVDHLSLTDHEIGYQDLWMEYTQEEVDIEPVGFEIRDTREGGNIDDFLDVFKLAYGDADADDPYGGLPPAYIEALQEGLTTDHLGDYDTHLVAYDEGTPVSIGSIIQTNDIAIIYNMGTVPDRQGEGIGSRIAERLIDDMIDAGSERILLQTEPGSYVADFYQGIGFDPLFEATAYIGGSWETKF